jgi:hypothetical protein
MVFPAGLHITGRSYRQTRSISRSGSVAAAASPAVVRTRPRRQGATDKTDHFFAGVNMCAVLNRQQRGALGTM